MTTSEPGQRVVVVGTSAGGVHTLRTLAAGLDPDFPAAVLVVQHLSPESPNLLPTLLQNAGPLPAAYAEDGAPIAGGRILLAPPDRHLAVRQGQNGSHNVALTRGPRQNRVRPSIDVLFRSAAVFYNARTIGVLLTGMLDDGVVGLEAVHRCGGVTVVQDPEEAPYPDMVRSALETVPVTYKRPVAGIAALLNELVQEPLPPAARVPADLAFEVSVNQRADSQIEQMAYNTTATTFSCPECGGRLWQTSQDRPKHYLCEVGHSYNQETLLAGMDGEVERSLWVALRTLEERTRMLERMAREEAERGRQRSASDLSARADEARKDSENVRRFLLKDGT